MITSIKDLIDGLEGITSTVSLLLERQHALLTREVEAICDTESLHLLQNVVAETSKMDERTPSLKFLSDAASHRLSIISDSRLTGLLYSNLSTRASSIRSYRTALSHRFDASSIPSLVEELDEDEVSISTGVPPLPEKDVDDPEAQTPAQGRPFGNQVARRAAETPIRAREVCSSTTTTIKPRADAPTPSTSSETIPQNQRLIADLIRKSQTQSHPPTAPDLPFSPDCSSTYGKLLAPYKEIDASVWSSQSTNFLIHADKGSLSARRIFLELRSIQAAGIPFISAAPLNDGSLDKLIARIEGPPGTPYEGGIFWILVSFTSSPCSSGTDLGVPHMRFLTKIYHPNIDCQGNICGGGNYSEWWNDLEQIGTESTSSSRQLAGPWFSSKMSNWFSLGALLTALCGLLATPNVEDPLVVEIAETYLRDYEAYCAAARLYTQRYAGRDVKPVGFEEAWGDWEDWGVGNGQGRRDGLQEVKGEMAESNLQSACAEEATDDISESNSGPLPSDLCEGEKDDTVSTVPTLQFTATTMTTSTIRTESTVTTPSHKLIRVPEFLKRRGTKSKESLVTRYFSPRRRRASKQVFG